MHTKLDHIYFNASPYFIAKDLLGRLLFTNIDNHITSGIIVETEIYRGGEKDKASHAHFLKKTKRTNIMFSNGGYCYVYLVYGIYYQFCITTSQMGIPDTILIRALEPRDGIDTMKQRRHQSVNLTNGPGRLTQALGIDKDLHEKSITGSQIWISKDKEYKRFKIVKSKRIGIGYSDEYSQSLMWRFYIKDNKFISKK